jgi:hypothetical protein
MSKYKYIINNIFPPYPPSENKEKEKNKEKEEKRKKIIPGEFNYVNDKNYKIMLVTAWKAIDILELWDFVKEDIESFACSTDPRLGYILNQIEKLGYDGHSGVSFGLVMRNMQYIIKNGEEEFIKMVLKLEY